MLGGEVKDEAAAVTAVGARAAVRGAVAVDVEVVPDDVDGALGILHGDRAHEAPQVFAPPPRAAGRDDLSRAHVERRDDRPGAVPGVLPFPTRAATGLSGPPVIG